MKIMKIVSMSIAMFAISLFVSNCSQVGSTGSGTVAGYVYNADTGAVITDYDMEIETPAGLLSVAGKQITISTGKAAALGDATTLKGKFSASVPFDAQYVVRVTATGFRNFVSDGTQVLNEANYQATTSAQKSELKKIFLKPTPTATTIAVAGKITVQDDTGAAIKSPVLVNTAVSESTVVTRSFNLPGTNIAENTQFAFLADITGSATTGVIDIPKDTLRRGYTYNFAVLPGAGYDNCTNWNPNTTQAVDTLALNSSAAFNSSMTNGAVVICNRTTGNTGTLSLVSASNVATSNGVTRNVIGVTSATYSFNQDVVVNQDALMNTSITALVQLAGRNQFANNWTNIAWGGTLPNTNGSAATNTITLKAGETVGTNAAPAKSSLLTITVSANTIKVDVTGSYTESTAGEDDLRLNINAITGALIVDRKASSANSKTGVATTLNTVAGYNANMDNLVVRDSRGL